MKTSYPKELAEWAGQQPQTVRFRRKESLAAFLAVRANVLEARSAGYSLKCIWEHMRETGRVPFRYETFLKHVRRHITNASAALHNPAPAKETKGRENEPRKSDLPMLGGFRFNPTPKNEDLF